MLISFHNRYNLLTKIENMRLGSARFGSGLGFAFGLVPNAANANECQYEYECVNSERIVRGCVRVLSSHSDSESVPPVTYRNASEIMCMQKKPDSVESVSHTIF